MSTKRVEIDAGQGPEPDAETTGKSRGESPTAAVELRGLAVASGLALGPVHRQGGDLSKISLQRVPLDGVENELNRFHRSLKVSRAQLADLKRTLADQLPTDNLHILDTHEAYLKDPVFLADVENLILNEQMALEGAIAKVIGDFDRIFRLVQSETLRERAMDLRDVGIRVLRNLEHEDAEQPAKSKAPRAYILAARELTVVDIFNIEGDHVVGILTESGGLTSHAAILARSMRIPTLTGVTGLLDTVQEGDFVILDATEGVVRVNPDGAVVDHYDTSRQRMLSERRDQAAFGLEGGAARTADGSSVLLGATASSPSEVQQVVANGVTSVLYRTELLYLVERRPPSLDALVASYRAVFDAAGSATLTFRLLDVESGSGLDYLNDTPERNPGLGLTGARLLFAREDLLRTQLHALLTAAGARDLRVALPSVMDCSDLRRLREVLFEERRILSRTTPVEAKVALGAVLETPVAVLGAARLAQEADFLELGLDGVLQYMLAADRDHAGLSHYFDSLHPVVVRTLRQLVESVAETGTPLFAYGAMLYRTEVTAVMLGIGLSSLRVQGLELSNFARMVSTLELPRAVAFAERVESAGTLPEARDLQL